MKKSQAPSQSRRSPLSLASVADRRAEPRLSAEILGLDVDARLAPGIPVRVINLSSGGALFELDEWVRPGTTRELRLSKPLNGQDSAERVSAKGQIVRCWVHQLSPLRYRAALFFTEHFPAQEAPGDPSDGEELVALLECQA